jgi:hypothetical protein
MLVLCNLTYIDGISEYRLRQAHSIVMSAIFGDKLSKIVYTHEPPQSNTLLTTDILKLHSEVKAKWNGNLYTEESTVYDYPSDNSLVLTSVIRNILKEVAKNGINLDLEPQKLSDRFLYTLDYNRNHAYMKDTLFPPIYKM